jgi:hypothetical protein
MKSGEKISERIGWVTWHSQVEEIDYWRSLQHPIPSRNAAIRELVRRALAANDKVAAFQIRHGAMEQLLGLKGY